MKESSARRGNPGSKTQRRNGAHVNALKCIALQWWEIRACSEM